MNANSDLSGQSPEAYSPLRVPLGIHLRLRGLPYYIRHWPAKGQERQQLLLLHGWMDVSASFQFLVDQLPEDWSCFAPDWRGFGLSERSGADTYWFADYLADLDALVDALNGLGKIAVPTNLLGHSMGGNIACLYAGVRPERISRLINLEGFGLPASDPAKTPARYVRWLDGIASGVPSLRAYPSLEEVAARLMRNNPRLLAARAAFLAGHWSAQGEDGQWHLRADPWHKATHPIPYRADEVSACWRAIRAPTLWVSASETHRSLHFANTAEYLARLGDVAKLRKEVIQHAGHMLHHDQPEALARLICDFLDA